MNVDDTDGLTNGVMGAVKNVITRSRNAKEMIEAILVVLDRTKVGTEAILHSKYKDVND